MKYLLAVALFFLLAVFQVSAMPYVRVLGVTPDLVLILAVCWTMVRGQGEGMVVIPLAGLLRDLVTSDPLGTSVLALAPVVLLAWARDIQVLETEFIPTLGVVVLGSIIYGLISMTVLAATGWSIPWWTGVLHVVLPSAVVNALFAITVYLPVRWLSLDLPYVRPSLPTRA